jgi:hypothetical protein
LVLIKPGDVATEFELGRICERNGDVACARPLREDVAARYPDLLAVHYALSRIYTKLQLTEKAVRENAEVRRILDAQPRRAATNAVPDLTEELPVPSLGPERRWAERSLRISELTGVSSSGRLRSLGPPVTSAAAIAFMDV